MMTNKKEIIRWLDEMGIINYTINDTSTVTVKGDVYLDFKGLVEIPVQFRIVYGNFNCSNNSLTTLKGSPREVGGDFDCSFNELNSLLGAPKEVAGGFDCSMNMISSLVGGPSEVGKFFHVYANNLRSLTGSPQEIDGDFDCSFNILPQSHRATTIIGGLFINSHNN